MLLVQVVLAAVLGALAWTLLEYLIHRFLGHGRRLRRTPFGIEHVRHHAEGDYFAPTWKKAVVAALVLAAIAPAAGAVAGATAGLTFAAGLIACYVGYEVQHRRNHTHAARGRYGRWLRRHHFHHHFVEPRANHGVTSPLWDVVFGTLQRPARITVPRRLAMAWLVDPATGEVGAAHAADYALGKAPRAPAP